MTLKYIQGDLFASITPDNQSRILIPHCCNDMGVMGSGFIVPLVKFNKAPRECYLDWFDKDNHKEYTQFKWNSAPHPVLGECQIVACPSNEPNHKIKVGVANMIGQHKIVSSDNPKPIKYWALAKAMTFIRDNVKSNKLKVDEIRAPKFGSGLAQGNWDFIETLIKEIWVDEGIPVTIYHL
jgi:hypothetical protein